MTQPIKITAILSIFLLLSCGGKHTKLVSSWSPQKMEAQNYAKIGIGVLIPNTPNRVIVEIALEEKLKEKQLNAVATYNMFPLAGKAKEIIAASRATKEEVQKVIDEGIQKNNLDALMLVTLLDVKKEKRYVETSSVTVGMGGYGGTGYYGTSYADPYNSGYSDYYSYALGSVYSQGYYTEDITYFVECNLYDVKTKKLLWTGHTKSVNMKNLTEESQVFSSIIADELLLKNIVKP